MIVAILSPVDARLRFMSGMTTGGRWVPMVRPPSFPMLSGFHEHVVSGQVGYRLLVRLLAGGDAPGHGGHTGLVDRVPLFDQVLSGPDGGLEAGRGAGLGDDAERGPACLGVHAVDGDPEFVGEIVTDGGIGPCVGLAAQRGQERGGVAHRGRRIPVHARQSGTGASVLGADRHVERAQTHVESPAAPRGAGEVVVAVDLHTPVLVGLPHLPTDRVVRLGGKRLHIHLLTGEQAADRRALAVMRLLGHRVATLQHVPGQLAVGLCVEHGHHDVAAQEPDRVLHAALLVARVRVAEPGLQPVMLHEQFEHVHDGDLVPRDPMAGAGGVGQAPASGGPRLCARTPCAAPRTRIRRSPRAGPRSSACSNTGT